MNPSANYGSIAEKGELQLLNSELKPIERSEPLLKDCLTTDPMTNYCSIAEKGESSMLVQEPKTTTKEPEPLPRLQDWMSRIPSSKPMSALSIPGTHDSASFMSTWPFVSTQTLTTTQQLDAGIRYFDLRCGTINNIIEMVHGRAVLGLQLSVMLQDMYTWLDSHPTEALIVQLKQDRKDESSTIPFSTLITSLLRANARYWRVEATTPTLGQLRGRIQLLRRFTAPRLYNYGINVSRWQDNPPKPFTITTYSNVHLTIQDHYSWSTAESLPNAISQKGGDIYNLLLQAAANPDLNHWYINFCSAYEFNVWYQFSPREIALGGYWVFRWVDGINIRLKGTLETVDRPQRLGVVLMDFPELPQVDLIKKVVETNFEDEEGGKWRSGSKVVVLLVMMMLALWLLFEMCWSVASGGRWCSPLLHICGLKMLLSAEHGVGSSGRL